MGLLALAIGNPMVALAGVGIAASALSGAYVYVHHKGYVEGKAEVQAHWDTEKEGRRLDSAHRTDELAVDYAAIIRRKDAQIAGIYKHLDSALSRLSDRSSTRLPDVAPAECAGATGIQLSRPDAEFLTREAARANEIREALGECYAEVDAIRLRLSPAGAAASAPVQ